MVNKVILLGRAGKDPEVRRMDNNMAMARFTLATSEFWSKDGNRTEHTEWHNIVMWRGLAETAEKYVRKGSQLYIEGKIRNRTWEKDGVKHYGIDIEAEVMRFVGNRPEGQAGAAPLSSDQAAPSAPIETTELDAAPDDLPF